MSSVLTTLLRESEVEEFLRLKRRIVGETASFLANENDLPNLVGAELRAVVAQTNAEIRTVFPLHLVARADENMIGFLSFRPGQLERVRHRGELTLGVLQSEWGRGAGRSLLRCLEEWARAHGIIRLELSVLESNVRAVALYHSCGYQVEGRKRAAMNIRGELVDGLWMAKILDESAEVVHAKPLES